MIDDEHARLERYLSDLRDACLCYEYKVEDCADCPRTQVATCQGRLMSFLYDFIDLVGAHFEHEETIMRHQLDAADDDGQFLAHLAAHARLAGEIRQLAGEAGALGKAGNPAQAIRVLEQTLSALFGEHASRYDEPVLFPAR